MNRNPRVHGIVLTVVLLFATGCASGGRSVDARVVVARPEAAGIVRAESTTSLDGLYDAAIFNSAVFRAEHQHDLWPVSGPTDMGSMISCDCPRNGCSSKCALQPGPQTAPTDIWVSPSEQLQQFCASFPQDLTAEQVILKLQQLQGLPPQTGQDVCTWQILQVTVDDPKVPAHFFRPCPNPDPTTKKKPCPADFAPGDAQVTDAFAAWMAGQAFSAWQVPNGYPWTHLGYTYNWDPAASSIVGTSEYVIPQSSPVRVTGLVPAVELCTQGRLTCP